MREDIYSFLPGSGRDPEFFIDLTGISYCDDSYRISRRNSNIYVFEYILEGEGTVICDGKTFTAVKGDGYILKKYSNHEYYSHKENPWTKIWFNAQGPLIDVLLSLYGLNNLSHIEGIDLSPYFFRIVKKAQASQNSESFTKDASLIFFEMLLFLQEHLHSDVSPESEEAALLKAYIEKHNKEQISLDTLSRLIYRSPSQTIRIFRQAYGITPYQYLMKQKLDLAKLLLLNTTKSIKEISLDLDFHDEHYFSNYFKDKCGASPQAFRKSGGNIV